MLQSEEGHQPGGDLTMPGCVGGRARRDECRVAQHLGHTGTGDWQLPAQPCAGPSV